MSDLTDETEVRRFCKIIHEQAAKAFKGIDRPGHLQLCRLHNLDETGFRVERFAIGDDEHMATVAIAHARSDHNVWVEGRVVRAGLPVGSKGSKGDTVGVFALVIDSDADKGKAGLLPLAPSLSVESSPGNSHHWLFFEKALPWEEADEIGARLRAAAGADSDTGNITQPYRVAGTPNLLTPKKRARGRTETTRTRVLDEGGPVYSADTMRAALPALPVRELSAVQDGAPRDIAALLDALPDELREELATPAGDLDDRSGHFFGVSGKLKVHGFSFEEVLALWEHFPAAAAIKYATRRSGVRHQLEMDWPKLDTRDEAAAKGMYEPSAEEMARANSPENNALLDDYLKGLLAQPAKEAPGTGLGAQPSAAPETQRSAPQPSTQPKLTTPLETVRASVFAPLEKPRREFLFADLMPARNVTSLYGDGGVGKTLLALQASVAVATGTHWLGMKPTKAGPVVYFGAEDEIEETHIRVKEICAADMIEVEALTDLHIIDMAGKDALLAVENAKGGTMNPTLLFKRLQSTLSEIRPVLLVLDNLADIFGGNEISKSHSRQFVGMLRGLAREFGCFVLLLAHPSQSGKTSGEGTSGNSAWNNSVRQRLYLMQQFDDPAAITDDRIRRLAVKKSNYSPKGGEVEIRWDQGRFAPTSAGGAPIRNVAAGRAAMDAKADAVFLALVEKLNHQGFKVFPSSGRSFAPLVFAGHPDAAGITKAQFTAAMHRLFNAGRIQLEKCGKPSAPVEKIVVVPMEEVPM